ncbi:MAG: recombinase family protein [Moorellaceae bacterium]
MLAVIYVRVSTEDQARHGYSLEAQEEACRRKAMELGATRVEIYRDEGYTGEIMERPGLQAALAAAKSAAFFIAYDPDRLSRRLAHQLLLVETIEKAGCRLEFVTMDWQATPEGRLFYSLRGAIAEYEKEKFKLRSQFGRLAKAKQGYLPFNPKTYGYLYSEGKYEIDEAKAAVYRRMVDMALSGKSCSEIAAALNAEGIPGPQSDRWYRQTVRRVLKNPAYKGTLYVHMYDTEGHKAIRQRGGSASPRIRPQEDWVAVPVPPLISPEEWELLQQAITARRRGNQGGKTYYYPLSGLVYCGLCGGSMCGSYGKSRKGNIFRYYICTRAWPSVQAERRNLVSCPGNRHRADKVEEAVWGKVREWLSDPEALVRDVLDTSAADQAAKEAGRVKKRLEQAERERERVFEAYKRGLISLEMFERAVKDLEAEKKVLEARLKEIEETVNSTSAVRYGVAMLHELAREVAGRLDDLDWQDREKLIRLLVRRVTLLKGEMVVEARVRQLETKENGQLPYEGENEISIPIVKPISF